MPTRARAATKKKKPASSSSRPGRPTKIDPRSKETHDYIRELVGRGMYEKDVAKCLGYHPNYFVELKKTHPEIADAVRAGLACGIERVTGALMDEIDGRNTTAILFYLKCKAGWRDNAGTDDDGAERDTESIGRRVLDDVRKVRARRG